VVTLRRGCLRTRQLRRVRPRERRAIAGQHGLSQRWKQVRPRRLHGRAQVFGFGVGAQRFRDDPIIGQNVECEFLVIGVNVTFDGFARISNQSSKSVSHSYMFPVEGRFRPRIYSSIGKMKTQSVIKWRIFSKIGRIHPRCR
jgi:hypothetical protein